MSSERSSYASAAEWLYKNAPTPPILPDLTPVPIFHNRVARGVGTLWEREDVTCIITASHIFQGSYDYGFWTYRIPYDQVPRMYPIENAQPMKPAMGYEIAFCALPEVIYSPYFKGFVDYDMNALLTDMMNRSSQCDVTNKHFTSLATGTRYACVSCRTLPNQEVAYIINKRGTTPGESGTGFIDDKCDLYVLSLGLNTAPDPAVGSTYSVLFPVPSFNLKKR